MSSSKVARSRIYAQEVTLVCEDFIVDADDLAMFIDQGGSIVVRGGRLLVVNQRPEEDEQLTEIDCTEQRPWMRIRQSCGMRYKRGASITALDGALLAFQRVMFKVDNSWGELPR